MATTIIRQIEGEDVDNKVSFSDLPFVHRHKWDGTSCGSNWHLPAWLPADYGAAFAVGQEWANDFLRYLYANGEMQGGNTLGSIVASMQPADTPAARGAQAGFFTRLQEIILNANPVIEY